MATNLLGALEEAADSATKKGNQEVTSNQITVVIPGSSGSSPPPETGNAGMAPASHYLISTGGTPSTLSPQSSQGANSIQDNLDSPSMPSPGQKQDQQRHPGPAGSTPGGGGGGHGGGGAATAALASLASQKGPLAGASAMLSNMLPSVAGGAGGNRSGHATTTTTAAAAGATRNALNRSSPTIASSSRSPRLRPYRLGTLSSENSLGSVPETPTTTSSTLSARKGGLTDLPPRPSSIRKTPAKSSLRRPEPVQNAGVGRLSSFPLRRQSSVSWSEVLTTVKEIHSTPPGNAGQGAAAGASTSNSSLPSSSSSSTAAAASTPPNNNGALPTLPLHQQSPVVSPFPVPPMSPEARVAIEQPVFPGLMVLMMVFGILQRLLLSL